MLLAHRMLLGHRMLLAHRKPREHHSTRWSPTHRSRQASLRDPERREVRSRREGHLRHWNLVARRVLAGLGRRDPRHYPASQAPQLGRRAPVLPGTRTLRCHPACARRAARQEVRGPPRRDAAHSNCDASRILPQGSQRSRWWRHDPSRLKERQYRTLRRRACPRPPPTSWRSPFIGGFPPPNLGALRNDSRIRFNLRIVFLRREPAGHSSLRGCAVVTIGERSWRSHLESQQRSAAVRSPRDQVIRPEATANSATFDYLLLHSSSVSSVRMSPPQA